jgi:hypothetical protein
MSTVRNNIIVIYLCFHRIATGRRSSGGFNQYAPQPNVLEGMSIQSLQPPTQGDQATPNYRPHSASATPRSYKLMGSNQATSNQRVQSGPSTGVDGKDFHNTI